MYPTNAQKELISKHIGCCRLIYNLALETKITAYNNGNGINLSAYNLINQLPELKKEYPWLYDVGSDSLQQSILNLEAAYTNFFKKTSHFPTFKSKNRDVQTFKLITKPEIKEGKLYGQRFRDGISVEQHRDIEGKIKNITIQKTPSEKYYASIAVDTEDSYPSKKPIKKASSVGVDLGLTYYLIDSKGNKIHNPNFLKKSESKLKYIQRKYSKYRGKRTKHKLIILHEKVKNTRKDFLHKLSTNIIKNHDTIAVESLKIKNMLKNHKLAKSISDASWGMFVDFLNYKANWYGKNLLKIGTFCPSSKTCSNCGYINSDLKLGVKEWVCNYCGIIHDRDVNAAINIKNIALNKMVSGTDTKIQEELPSLEGVMILETSLI